MASVIAAFDEAQIDVRVLKGLATSELDHAVPASRRTTDVDLLVRPRQFDRACAVVQERGAVDVKPGQPAHLLVERTFRTPAGVHLDVHHRLFRFGRDDDGVLFENPQELRTAGCALPPEGRLVHAAAHLLITPPGSRMISSLFDVAVLAGSSSIDRARANELAALFGVDDVLSHAIWLAGAIGSADPDPRPVAASTTINRAHLRTRRRGDLELLATVRDAANSGDRLTRTLIRYQAGRAITQCCAIVRARAGLR